MRDLVFTRAAVAVVEGAQVVLQGNGGQQVTPENGKGSSSSRAGRVVWVQTDQIGGTLVVKDVCTWSRDERRSEMRRRPPRRFVSLIVMRSRAIDTLA